ncbi:MAG: cytochrome c biogenesis protein CcdA [Flavobacteriaceae bacterium]|nr:cytochrome c biogenesis protein CcdA [Flavobacteriaceae bacterium]
MKKFLSILLISIGFLTSLQAQIYDPVKWNSTVEKVTDSTFYLVTTASIQGGWHLYSQNVPDGGPIPTTFTYKINQQFELLEKTTEPNGIEIDDKVFDMRIKYFEHEAIFKQLVKIKNADLSVIKGEVEFMVCDDKNCLPPTIQELEFRIKEGSAVSETISTTKTPKGTDTSKRGLWSIFILSFLGGLAALLTPCVFPMIPMTVSFFTKQSKNKAVGFRNAIIYGLSIIAIYVLLGTVVTAIFGADSLNALSTNVWFNVIFFLLLVIFAISFLGAFEIVLPSSWGTKVDAQADRGGIIGILFMALALAIVSFSCTGPIVGTLLVEAASKGGIAPIIGMLGFSLALALPFGLFAAFPGWLNSLPKSGGWLNTVKVTLGFLELALAFKFLSNADLVLQLHWLEREVFLAIWIAIFGAMAFYLFGKITLPHDTPNGHISVSRFLLGLVTLAFTIYMIPGLWGAPLKLISGFPPPLKYSESPHGVGFSKATSSVNSNHDGLPDGAHEGPHDILAFVDYEKGMAYAKEVNKPVLIDFTGHACVNCRKMEDYVWSNPQVLEILKNQVVLISLYVDDKRELPLSEQYTSEATGKKIKYIGQKWSDFQLTHYKANAQPFYVLINHQEEMLIDPSAYNPDIQTYIDWLKGGIAKF